MKLSPQIVTRLKSFLFNFKPPISSPNFSYIFPKNNTAHSLLFLFSSFITLTLFVFYYNQLAILIFCLVWFLSTKFSGQERGKLNFEIFRNSEKRKTYQEEIINIMQTRYLLANHHPNDHQWLNFFIQKKWAKTLMKTFQNEIDLIAYSVFVDEKFSLNEKENLFQNASKTNEFLIDKDICRFDRLLLKETKPPVLHAIKRERSMRKDEIVFQLKIQFWIDIVIHNLVKDERKAVEDLEFLGSARLILLPLLNKYPFIGGFAFYFYRKLIFCFDSSHELLGLKNCQSKLISQLIYQKVNQILHNQNYKIQKRFIGEIAYHKSTSDGPILLCYVHLAEMLNLDCAVCPKNLTYFCLLKMGETIHQTRFFRNTASPKFNETFTFPIHDLYEMLRIKLYARTHEREDSVCIGNLNIKLPSNQNASGLESNTDSFFSLNSTFTGKSIWLPFKLKNSRNRLPFVNIKIALMQLTSDCTSLGNLTLEQITRNQPQLPVLVVSALLNNIQLDYLTNKYFESNKFNKDQIFCITAILNGTHQFGQKFFIKNSVNLAASKLRDVKFCFVDKLFQTAANELTFEILPITTNGPKKTLPGKVTIRLNELIFSRKTNFAKNITFKLHKFDRARPVVIIGSAELYLSMKTVLLHHSVLENLLQPTNQDLVDERLKPQNINLISYLSSHLSQKRSNFPTELHKPVHDSPTKKGEKQKKHFFEHPTDRKEEDKKGVCEILLAFNYTSDQLLLIDVIRVINVPAFSRESLPSPALLIELWKDKSRVAYSMTGTKKSSRDPFYGIQVQFEIGINKLSNLFLHILILENPKQTFMSKDKQQLLAESFIKIPGNILKVGNKNEPKWYKFDKIGVY